MSIKTEIIKPEKLEKPEKSKYPYIGKWNFGENNTCLMVLFTEPNRGMVLISEQGDFTYDLDVVGYYGLFTEENFTKTTDRIVIYSE